MAAIRSKNNKSTEMRLRMALIRAGFNGWFLNYDKIKGKPDIFFPIKKVAVFVDGCYWHGCPKCGHIPKTRTTFWAAKLCRNTQRDRTLNRFLRTSGIKVFRFWEHELQSKFGLDKVVRKLKRAIYDEI